MKSLLKLSAVVSLCLSLGACSTYKGIYRFNSEGSTNVHSVGKLPIKPVDQTMVLAANNTKDLKLALKEASITKKKVRIILTPGFYSIKRTLIIPKNTTLTTFNPTNGGANGPWIMSDVHNNDFVGPVVLMSPGSSLIGVNVKQLNSNPAIKINSLPVTIKSLELQSVKDNSLIFIDSSVSVDKTETLTLNGVTLTNMFLHKTAPSIRVGYSAPEEVHFIDSMINYPQGVLILPKNTKILAKNSVFNTDLSGLSNINLEGSKYHAANMPKQVIVSN